MRGFDIALIVVLAILLVPCLTIAGGATRGQAIYQGYCAVCHGLGGRGDGVSASVLIPGPPDFTSLEFKSSYSKDRVWDVVSNGKAESQMEGFRDKLPSEDIGAVIEYISSLK